VLIEDVLIEGNTVDGEPTDVSSWSFWRCSEVWRSNDDIGLIRREWIDITTIIFKQSNSPMAKGVGRWTTVVYGRRTTDNDDGRRWWCGRHY
jgi:hypothetical protein